MIFCTYIWNCLYYFYHETSNGWTGTNISKVEFSTNRNKCFLDSGTYRPIPYFKAQLQLAFSLEIALSHTFTALHSKHLPIEGE